MTKTNWDLQYLALEIRHRIKESMMEAHQLGIEGKDLDSAEIDYAVSSVLYSIGFEPVESVSYSDKEQTK